MGWNRLWKWNVSAEGYTLKPPIRRFDRDQLKWLLDSPASVGAGRASTMLGRPKLKSLV